MKFSDSQTVYVLNMTTKDSDFFVELLDIGNRIKTEHVEPTDYCQWCFQYSSRNPLISFSCGDAGKTVQVFIR